MIAEENSWSVTIYGNNCNADKIVLRFIADSARARRINFGSVGVFPLPFPVTDTPPWSESEASFIYIWFPYTRWKDVALFLVSIEINVADIRMVRVRQSRGVFRSRRRRTATSTR
jgi:hypothetical protein